MTATTRGLTIIGSIVSLNIGCMLCCYLVWIML